MLGEIKKHYSFPVFIASVCVWLLQLFICLLQRTTLFPRHSLWLSNFFLMGLAEEAASRPPARSGSLGLKAAFYLMLYR